VTWDADQFWSQLTEAESASLRERGRLVRWRKDEVLFHEHDQSDWVVVLMAGRVKVATGTPTGGEVVLAVRDREALIGELAAIDRQPRSATVTALAEVIGLVVLLPAFEAFLAEHPRVAAMLPRLVVGRLRDSDRKRVEFGAHDTTGRVAARLVELAERFGQTAGDQVKIAMPLSQDELASWTGSSREAVSKALSALRSLGWIETSRLRVVIRDLAALRARARGDEASGSLTD
jgi:CRP/FNR family transcriptional regulator, cyclic AMP receptor protein